MSSEKISVLIVDDSALARRLLSGMISSDPELEVAGEARNGIEAISMTRKLNPDVVTMDVLMPEMDGLAALEYIMNKSPRPVVMISALTKEGADFTLRALELGAVDCIAKPDQFLLSQSEAVEEILVKIKAAARSRAREVWEKTRKGKPIRKFKRAREKIRGGRIFVIGASAGGPKVISEILPALPADLSAPMVLVQHIPEAFTASLAERLDAKSSIKVKKAEQSEELKEGVALVVPGDKDLVLERISPKITKVRLVPTSMKHGASPVIDVTMESAAEAYGSKAVGILLTGMGTDGAEGLAAIKQAGGDTIVQDGDSCLIFGMPKVAIERGLAGAILPPQKIAQAIVEKA